jgi:hypothetical protein
MKSTAKTVISAYGLCDLTIWITVRDPYGFLEMLRFDLDDVERMDIRIGDTLMTPFVRKPRANHMDDCTGFAIDLTKRPAHTTAITEWSGHNDPNAADAFKRLWMDQFKQLSIETIIPTEDDAVLESYAQDQFSPFLHPCETSTSLGERITVALSERAHTQALAH